MWWAVPLAIVSVAISIGMILTMFLFMKRVSETTQIRNLVEEEVFDEKLAVVA